MKKVRLPLRMAASLCALIGFFALPAAAAAQGPPPPPPPVSPGQGRDAAVPKTGTARLSGRVTTLDTGRPVRRAQVRASGSELREGKTVSTDGEGRWTLGELPAGRYTVTVTKGGYVSLSYGQRRPFETGKNIDLAAAQNLDKLDVALPRGGAITGRVVDEFGEPITGVRVMTMRHRFVNGERRLLSMGGSDSTDDLGQYRLFALPPGEYYVAAQSGTGGMVGASEDRTGYVQMYFPNTANPAEATRVLVALGQEAPNVVITMTPARLVNISGTAVNAAGQPFEGMGFIRDYSSGTIISRPFVVTNGTWSVNGVAAGEYIASVTFAGSVEELERVAATGTNAGLPPAEVARQPLTVAGEDITGVALVTGKGGTIKGRLRFEGTAPAKSGPVTVDAFELSNASSVFNGVRVRPDGTFEVARVFNRRILRVSNLPGGWVLKSVVAGGDDVTDTGLDVPASGELSDVEVVVAQQAGEISGTVTGPKNAPATDYVVVLFPQERERWAQPFSRFVKVARPDQAGQFAIRDLPPASYLAVALEYIEPGDETNPEFLEKLKALATSVRLAEGGKQALTLKLSRQ